MAELRELRILVCGKAGVGKSSLVNSILGEDVALVGGPGTFSYKNSLHGCLSSVTKKVEKRGISIRGISVFVYDSPGLQDGSENDESYLKDIGKVVEEVQLILYCFEMAAARWLPSDQKCIENFYKKFGTTFWSKAILVLTKANYFQYGGRPLTNNKAKMAAWEKRCEKAFDDLAEDIKVEVIKLGLSKDVVDNVPVISAGDNNKEPEERVLIIVAPKKKNMDYLAELWVQCLLRLPPESRLAFLQACDAASIRLSHDAEGSTAVSDSLTKLMEAAQKLYSQLPACAIIHTPFTYTSSTDASIGMVFNIQQNTTPPTSTTEVETSQNEGTSIPNSPESECSAVPQTTRTNQVELNESQATRAMDATHESIKFICARYAKIGAKVGAVVGSIVPIAGTIVGAGFGAAIGAVVGYFVDLSRRSPH